MHQNTRTLVNITKDVRRDILTMSYRAQSAHTGGALSCVEILVSLYFQVMKVFPSNPDDPRRDRLVFSKAHDAKALYAVLAARGFFGKRILEGYEQNNGLLAGHSIRHSVPGIEVSAGSLGHGLSMAAGMALVGKTNRDKWKVFTVLSDGECDEGSVWEAALFAGHHALDNLIAVVDANGLQGYGRTKDVLNLEPFAAKWQAFGWQTREVDGHNMNTLTKVLQAVPFRKGKPSVIIAHTVKGLGGVAKHIGQVSSQYKPPTKEEYDETINKLENR